MDYIGESTEMLLRSICCTCLSVDRKLTQLCRVENGVNSFFFLLSYDPVGYKATFEKAAAHLHVCWECKAIMLKLCNFRNQVCLAQKQLSDIADGRIDIKHNLSKLSFHHQNTYAQDFTLDTHYNFIDCGPEIKTESIELPIDNDKGSDTPDEKLPKLEIKLKDKKRKRKQPKDELKDINYSTIEMTESEMYESREKRKMLDTFITSSSKCESCIEPFKDYNELEKHNLELHVQKPRYIQCNICQVYIKYWWLSEHTKEHYTKHKCNYCDFVCADVLDVLKHLKAEHGLNNELAKVWQKVKRRAAQTNPALKSRRIKKKEVKTPLGYLCYECNKYFDNKYLRYKHILKFHREGFKCPTCGKTFAFKNTLNKHEQIHGPPPPRAPCAVCGALVRRDRERAHALLHSARAGLRCEPCGKRFVSRDSYGKHLRNSASHAERDVHKYKCTMCEKGFRTLTELNDHVNYKHMGRTHHKCPICNKALATRRGVTRHVRRAHDGVKEKTGDKILCQTCGKAFRDKKCLLEHELIHTGEKPLSCELCARTFRQSAGLYTHRRRVHNMAPKRTVLHADDIINDVEQN